MLGWVLLGFVALPAVPQAAHAQAVKEIWSGTLTTGSTTTSPTLFGFGTDTPGGSLGTVADRTIPELQGGGARYVTVLINDNASGGTLRLFLITYGVPWKGTVPQRVRIPPGKLSLQPVAIGADDGGNDIVRSTSVERVA